MCHQGPYHQLCAFCPCAQWAPPGGQAMPRRTRRTSREDEEELHRCADRRRSCRGRVLKRWSCRGRVLTSLFIYPRSVALASRSHIDHPFNIAIGPLGIWSFSVLQTRKNLGAPRITYVKHRVYAGATKSHNSCFVGQSWIGV